MTRDEILNATPEQLRVMVAERLGWCWVTNIYYTWIEPPTAEWIEKYREMNEHQKCGRPDDWDEDSISSIPDWPSDIAAAWELDGDGWFWSFCEFGPCLSTTVDIAAKNRRIRPADFMEPWRETKQQTYAVARCRAWLLAKFAESQQ